MGACETKHTYLISLFCLGSPASARQLALTSAVQPPENLELLLESRQRALQAPIAHPPKQTLNPKPPPSAPLGEGTRNNSKLWGSRPSSGACWAWVPPPEPGQLILLQSQPGKPLKKRRPASRDSTKSELCCSLPPTSESSGMRGSTLIGTSGGGGNGRGCRGSAGEGSAEGSAASECSGLRSPCSPSPTGPPRALQHGKSP